MINKIIQQINNKAKGYVGEKIVNRKLNPFFFNNKNHKTINNLILIDDNNNSHQIDHVEIRENGIFCIETKNYEGWLFGNENSQKWYQTFPNGKKFEINNPLKQNKSHCYYIFEVLGKKYKINSIVVLIKDNAEKLNISNVVNISDLNEYLKNFNSSNVLSIEEINSIYDTLIEANNKMSNRKHVKNIKEVQRQLKNNICPRCGCELVEKTGKYGSFKGCSNYLECKFILKDN